MVVAGPRIYATAAGTSSDLEFSLRSWIRDRFPSYPLVAPDDWNRFKRPVFSVQTVNSKMTDAGAKEYRLDSDLVVSYHAPDYPDCRKIVSQVEGMLTQMMVFPVWLYDFKLPPPYLSFLSGPGLPPGTYYFALTGFNTLGEETMASPILGCSLQTDGQIVVQGAAFPQMNPMTVKYRLWVGTQPSYDALLYYGEFLPMQGWGKPQIVVDHLPTAQTPQPPATSKFSYGSAYLDEIISEVNRWRRDTWWDGDVRIAAHMNLTRETWAAPPLSEAFLWVRIWAFEPSNPALWFYDSIPPGAPTDTPPPPPHP